MSDEYAVVSGRLAFANGLKEKSEKGRYGTAFILDEGQEEKIKPVLAAAIQAQWGAKPPAGLRNPLRPQAEKEWAGLGDSGYYINAYTKFEPVIVNEALERVIDPAEIYSGRYANLKLNAYTYDTDGNRGVGLGLVAVQLQAHGDRLGGKSEEQVLEGFAAGQPVKPASGGSLDDPFGDMV